jgi:5'-nucleotidase
MITRRQFLARGAAGLAWLGLGSLPERLGGPVPDARAATDAGETIVTILHTNDVHSRIDPFPEDGGRNGGLGGAARRATLIRRIRAENPNTLLVDAGDVFQGTPYFNLFKGEVDFRVMSALGYDAMNIGNHDFDGGVEGLLGALPFARFPLVNANYDFGASPLGSRVQPYLVRDLGPARVGVFGLGVELDALVAEPQRPGITYGDPVPVARRLARELRAERGCDLVVCLSHLGNDGWHGQPGDQDLARQVEGIDLIVGGHSHTFMAEPTRVRHAGRETLVFQVGWAGINLGRVDFRLRRGAVTQAQGWALPVDGPASPARAA